MLRILSSGDVRAAIGMSEAIDAVRAGFVAVSLGQATVPLRGVLTIQGNTTLTMPAYIEGEPISVVKIVSVYPDNPSQNLPTITASVLVLDAQTGVPVALLDGRILTAIRTGAASGLATDLLAREDARILGVIGAGAQARTQIEAVCSVRPISEIRIYSPHTAHILTDEIRSQYDAHVVASETPQNALKDADIIVAATNSSIPVVQATDLSPGTHINGIGSFKPEMQEVAADVVTRAKVVVDHRESAWAEAGDLIIPRDQGLIQESDIYAEIGEIAAGKLLGRTNSDEITFFKSVGNAVQDAAVAARIFAIAEERGLGNIVEL